MLSLEIQFNNIDTKCRLMQIYQGTSKDAYFKISIG